MIQMSNKTQQVTGINVWDTIKFSWHTKAAFCCHCAQLCRASFAVTADTPHHGKHVWLHVRAHVCVCVCVCVQSVKSIYSWISGVQSPTGEQSAAMLKMTLDPPTSWILHLTSQEADHLLPFHSEVYNAW